MMSKPGVTFSMTHTLTALAASLMIFLASAGPTAAAQNDHTKANFQTEISVEFGSDCTAATVRSSNQVSSLVAILSNGAWEKLEDLTQAPSYSLRVDHDGPNAGAAFDVLYVESGSYQQMDPLGIAPGLVGIGFPCEAN
jgi:hypothetical protein